MLVCRYSTTGQRIQLGVVQDDEVFAVADLTVTTLLNGLEDTPEETRRQLAASVNARSICRWSDLLARQVVGYRLLKPLDDQEVWAAGVTYQRSAQAREDESKQSGIYDRVYSAERPELFFKAMANRTVDHGEAIFIRSDASWNVPEPELALLIGGSGTIVGYTVGNDVSSRDIEGANPLYLPQAKVYSRCCALGPAILLADSAVDPRNMPIHLDIQRAGATVFTGDTSTARMKRTPEELVRYLLRDNPFPNGVFLLTGTGIVPPDDFTLDAGDVVSITIPGIGTLRNPVERAPGDARAR